MYGNRQTLTVQPDELRALRRRTIRAGGRVVSSAPIGRGYAVTIVLPTI